MAAVNLPSTGLEPGSPTWWVTRLAKKIRDDDPAMSLWWRYFVGDHPIPQAPGKVRARVEDAYSEVLKRSNANFMDTVISAYVDRCRPIGFRLGADGNYQDDLGAWRIWQASQMDADFPLAAETAFAKGRSYLSVWKRATDEFPTIAAEDPSQCIVEHEPGSRHRRRAALKLYTDEWTGQDRVDLFLRAQDGRPAGLYQFRRDPLVGSMGGWVALPGNDEFQPNPQGWDGIPVVPLTNRARLAHSKLTNRKQLLWGGESDLADVTSIQDRINETILARVIAIWFASFKQKWATGLALEDEPVLDSDGNPELDDNGQPKMAPAEPFDVWMDRLMWVDSKDVKFGEFTETDITQFLKSHERDLQDLSTIKRIPRHYLFQEGQSPSGDAIKSAETGLVALVRRKHLDLGDPAEETVRIGRIFNGERDAPADSELVWADPEFQTYGQLADGVIKEFESGLLPWEGAMEKLGYTPQQIARFRGQRNMDALLRAAEETDDEAA